MRSTWRENVPPGTRRNCYHLLIVSLMITHSPGNEREWTVSESSNFNIIEKKCACLTSIEAIGLAFQKLKKKKCKNTPNCFIWAGIEMSEICSSCYISPCRCPLNGIDDSCGSHTVVASSGKNSTPYITQGGISFSLNHYNIEDAGNAIISLERSAPCKCKE